MRIQCIARPLTVSSSFTIGTLFSAWHATTHALQPVHLSRSITIVHCRSGRSAIDCYLQLLIRIKNYTNTYWPGKARLIKPCVTPRLFSNVARDTRWPVGVTLTRAEAQARCAPVVSVCPPTNFNGLLPRLRP